jgi:hypothetical protein
MAAVRISVPAAAGIAALLGFLAVGLYGAHGYLENFLQYRGFAPPREPAFVSQPGTVQRFTVPSAALGRRRQEVYAYLPSGYAQHPERRYPVLYLLHGFPGRPLAFLETVQMGVIDDALTARRRAQAVILVMPFGSTGTFADKEWVDGASPHDGWGTFVARDVVRAIDQLAGLPGRLKDMLAARLDGIYVGPGGVPDLDDMRHLRGVPLPSGDATWDICAGAYGMRKIVIGARPSPTPDVMCHEVGHALDDIDAPDGQWQSDSAQFSGLYDRCLPHLVSDFHLQGDGLGRREFFADAFAAIASRQRPALVDMLGGNTREALNVMLYFNRRYEI